jgi:citrate synthase
MAKPKKDDIQQMMLDELAALRLKVEQLTQQQQQQPARAKREKGQPRADVYYVLLGVPSKDVPPQAMAVARALATAPDTNHITEAEAMDLIEAYKTTGKLKTIQPAWRIFQYYRADLINGDYLLMKTVV